MQPFHIVFDRIFEEKNPFFYLQDSTKQLLLLTACPDMPCPDKYGPIQPTSSQQKGQTIREVCKKSKWKFKMAFAMKGGGSRGGLVCH